jgi:hypothetical protein
MRWWRRLERDPWNLEQGHNGLSEYEVTMLADYNAEKGRGIAHAPLWQEEMARLQARWNAGERERLIREGWTELPGGGWIKSPT